MTLNFLTHLVCVCVQEVPLRLKLFVFCLKDFSIQCIMIQVLPPLTPSSSPTLALPPWFTLLLSLDRKPTGI